MRISRLIFLFLIAGFSFFLIRYLINLQEYNNCELVDGAFMVSTYPQKTNAFFENKKATMYLKRSSKVQLQASNKYEGFHYSSIPVKVKNNLILEANCSEEGRLEDIFDSLNKQFKEE